MSRAIGKDAYVRAYVGLGANLGDRAGTLSHAIRALDEIPGVRLAGVSRLYETRPVGPAGQPDYLNAVVALDVVIGGRGSTDAAVYLLRRLKELEARSGRRPRERWGPRELDLDLLVFGKRTISVDEPELTVPHPMAGERPFVLAPLRDLSPRLRPPGWSENVARAYRGRLALEGPGAVRVVGEWDGAAMAWTPSGGGRRPNGSG